MLTTPTYDPTAEIQLWRGDCLELMRLIPDGTVDAVVTDPPYGISHETNHGASWEGRQIAGDSDTSLRDMAIEWAEDRGIPWLAFGNWKCQRPAKCRGVLIWDKGPASGMGDLAFPWKMSWEEIYVGGPGWRGKRDEGVLRGHTVITWESKGRKHPHHKPVSLMRDLIEKLPRGATILDPFAGSGSTLVAALKCGRRAIGIELDPAYHAIAHRRVAEAQTPLFDRLEVTA